MVAPHELGPVTIGAREIYDQVVAVRGVVDRLVDQHQDQERQGLDHEARLRALERGRWPLPTLSVVIALVAVVVAVYVALSRH